MRPIALALAALAAGCTTPQPAAATECVAPIIAASARLEVPAPLLAAVAIAESGKAGVPSPWALNVDGRAIYPASRAEAAAILRHELPRARNVDVGCMQISTRWHGRKFEDPADMLDPRANVDVGAAYLAELRAQLGRWSSAVAAYHAGPAQHSSPRARQYRCRVARQLAQVPQAVTC